MKQGLSQLETLYSKGQFKEGLSFLESMKPELDLGVYHYNKGTFLSKLNEFAEARLHFEKAKDFNFSSNVLENNLQVVKNNLGVIELEKANSNFEFIYNLFDSISKDYYLLFFLLFILISLVVIKRYKNISLAIFLLFLSIVPLGIQKFLDNQYKQAIVLSEKPIFDGPSEIFEQISEAPKGAKVLLSDSRENDWFLINYPESLRGWVKLSNESFLKENKNVH